MSKTFSKKPLALALGAAFGLTGMAAQASVFQVADLGPGYMVASKHGEAKCGAACIKEKTGKGMKEADAKAACEKMKAEGKCGEGKCGGDKKAHEGKCGEGKCGGDKKATEGKCGEGKCGGKK